MDVETFRGAHTRAYLYVRLSSYCESKHYMRSDMECDFVQIVVNLMDIQVVLHYL